MVLSELHGILVHLSTLCVCIQYPILFSGIFVAFVDAGYYLASSYVWISTGFLSMLGGTMYYSVFFTNPCAVSAGGVETIHDLWMTDMLRWWHFDLTCHRHALDRCFVTNGARGAQDE